MTFIYRKGNLDEFTRIVPELQKLVFGHWKIAPTITVVEDDYPDMENNVRFEISHPDASCELISEITDLVSAFLDGYILGYCNSCVKIIHGTIKNMQKKH
jgi:hypothetical protein